jgi:ATP-dependent DNA helicase RecQ
MVLSTAVRTGQYFGAAHLIDVLRGSKSEKVLARGHNQLPVYGIGSGIDIDTWRAVIRQLIARGMMHADSEAYGALKLTEEARPLLRSEASLFMRPIASKHDRRTKAIKTKADALRRTHATSADITLSSAEQGRFAALKSWRIAEASAANVPAFVAFSDSTLRAIARAAPNSREALLAVSGVGEAKLARYGDAVLKIVAANQ